MNEPNRLPPGGQATPPPATSSLWEFVALYFCEGAPIGFLWWALPTLLKQEDVSVERIAILTSLLALPWSFKFLFAPLVDACRGAWWSYREWALVAQGLMGLFLLPLLWLDWREQAGWLVATLMAHALAAAIQDCAIDAVAIHVVPAERRGALNGRMQAGMLLGRSLFGGGTLIIAVALGKIGLIVLLVGCIWGTMFVTRRLATDHLPRHSFTGYVRQVAAAAVRPATWGGVAVALLAGAGFEATGALSGPMLLAVGLTQPQIGGLYAIPVVALSLVGGLLGGLSADRWGSRAALVGWLVACSCCVLLVAALAAGGSGGAIVLLLGAWLAMYFCVGGFTASSYAWFMHLTNPRLGATQFSLYMSATNGCEALAARGAGAIYPRGGYGLAFAIPAVVSLLVAAAIGGMALWAPDDRKTPAAP
ncbi:MAG: MFS transporter [Pirellulales bacterium]